MGKEQIPKEATNYLMELSSIPNAPFLYKASSNYVISQLKRMGFNEGNCSGANTENTPAFKFVVDHLGVYAQIKRGESKRKVIITTHLDHPFIVLGKRGFGSPLGSVGTHRLADQLTKSNVPILVYSKEGELVGNERITDIEISKRRTLIRTSGVLDHEPNSHAVWQISPVLIEGDCLKMLAADDVATTAISLALIEKLTKSDQINNIDIEFVFTHVEEVLQASATGIALRGSTPFGTISSSDLIIPLECDYVEMSKKTRRKILSEGYKPANYEEGVILRVNDIHLIYGQKIPGVNLAESALLFAAQKLGMAYQQNLVGGSCDGTSFTLFANTPHIAGITIPTRFKHNWGINGEITHEEISLTDLSFSYHLLLELIKSSGKAILPHPNEQSSKLKLTKLAASPAIQKRLMRQRAGAFYSNLTRLKKGVFFPESDSDMLMLMYDAINARIIQGII